MIDNKTFLAPGDYPLLSVRLIENPNKMWAFPILGGLIKGLSLIPVAIYLYVLLLVFFVVTIINSVMVLATGQIPRNRERFEPAIRDLRGRERAEDRQHDPCSDDHRPPAMDDMCETSEHV